MRAALAAFLCAASLSAQVYGVPAPVRDRVLGAIADPNIALIFVVVGAFGIYAEFCLPGRLAPGVIGAISLFLGVTALCRFPVSRTGAACVILGLIFCILGARWPTKGIPTACGALGLTLGAVTLIDAASPGPHVRWSTAIALAIPFALVTSFLLSVAFRARRNKLVST
jgi:membrane-bound serine protease (ClpP class)